MDMTSPGLLRRRRYARQHRQVVDMNRGHDGLLYSRYNMVESTTIPTIAPECEHRVPAQLKTGRCRANWPARWSAPRAKQTLEIRTDVGIARGRSSSNAFTHIQRPYLTQRLPGGVGVGTAPRALKQRPCGHSRIGVPAFLERAPPPERDSELLGGGLSVSRRRGSWLWSRRSGIQRRIRGRRFLRRG